MPNPGNPQALNRFSYVLGNALKYRDPHGHMPQRALVLGLDSSPSVDWFGDRIAGLPHAASDFGIPRQVLGYVLDAEIADDTGFLDTIETGLLRLAPMPMVGLAMRCVRRFSDPGPGIGNIHVSTAIRVSRYMAENYAGDAAMQLGFHELQAAEVAKALSDQRTNIRAAAGYVRMLADYRFGSGGDPLLASHSDLDRWTAADSMAMWHGYRYGVDPISPGAMGFTMPDFQNRELGLQQFMVVAGGDDAARSIRMAWIYYVHNMHAE